MVAAHIAGRALLSRMPGLIGLVVLSCGTRTAFLFAIALKPVNSAFALLELVFRVSFAAIHGAAVFLHLVSLVLLHPN